jgi:hypothetical protein
MSNFIVKINHAVKKKVLLSITLTALMILSVPLSGQKVNSLTPEEQKAGWVLLFNGKDFTGWRQYNGTRMPKNWIIEDNAMKVFTAAHKRSGRGFGGDIIFSAKKFRNFELSVDWKTSRKGNSGIFYNVREVHGEGIYYAAPEVQILDNANASDNKTDSHLAGSLYDMLAADPKTVKPAGEWNTIVIYVKDGMVNQTQNGVKVVEYTLWTPEWNAMVVNSKFKNFRGFIEGIAKEGYIGLQDHGYAIWFRNIKIREF